MGRSNELVFALNAGGVDKEALSRVDLEKMRLSGEHPVANWLPKVTGPMTLRPGTEMLAAIPGNSATYQVKFARSIADSYILLMSDYEMRISDNGVVVQIPAVSTTINSGSWTDESAGSASATGGATLSFSATDNNPAKMRQSVTIAGADASVDNILRVVVSRGPLVMRVGSTAGGQEIIGDSTLFTGTHKIAINPGVTTPIYIEIRSDDPVLRTISQIDFEANLASGDLVLPTPWPVADLYRLRTWQEIDRVYVGDGLRQQRRIEHRGAASWSVTTYDSRNGPLQFAGASTTTMTPGALSGNTTLTSSEPFFVDGHNGSLIELTQTGKTVTETLDGESQATDYITVTGVTANRILYRTATESSFVGTLRLQRSVEPENPGVWTNVLEYVDGAADFERTAYDDGDDNLIAHYRFAISAGEYTSGSVVVTLDYPNTSQTALARITAVNSATSVDVEAIVNFGALTATKIWRIGAWSDAYGWPRVPIIHDDRLHWFDDLGRDYASVVDDFTNFDDTYEGDAGPFTRTVSGGGLEGVYWAQSDARLVVGTSGYEATIQANEFDGALTPTDYTSRKPSKRGSADIDSASHHSGLFFVQRAGKRIYELSSSQQGYTSNNVSRLNPNACRPGVVRLAVQLQPETRLYVVLSDGTMVVLTYETDDEVVAFTTIALPGGLIEDVCVLPDQAQDCVYLIVNRGGTRYHMRLSNEADQEAVSTCTLLDYHKVLTGSISSISGGTHLANTAVQVWADGARISDVTLNGSGSASLGATYARVVYGLEYVAEFKSSKIAYAASLGTAVGQEKAVKNIGLVLSNSTLSGIEVGVKMGSEVLRTNPLPAKIDGHAWTVSEFFEHLDIAPFPQESAYSTDTRFVIKASSADGPVTVQSVVIDVETPETYTPRR